MSIIYLVALAGVALVLLAVMFEAAVAVTRKPVWGQAQRPQLVPVVTHDRREQSLPFVGVDRRTRGAGEQAASTDTGRRVA